MSALVKSPPPFAVSANLCPPEKSLVGFPEPSHAERPQPLIDCMPDTVTVWDRFATEPRRAAYSKRILSFELAARDFNVLR